MKLLTFVLPDSVRQPRLGAMVGDWVVDLAVARGWCQGARAIPAQELPESMLGLLHAGPEAWAYVRQIVDSLQGLDLTGLKGPGRAPVGHARESVYLYPPLPRPTVLRDFYAFEQHVRTAHEIRDRAMPEEWYRFPAFYYCNPNTMYGPDETIPYPRSTEALDYELEVACVIGLAGQDIPAERASSHIFGYTILNDWSARDLQRVEMRVGLGPAKGKDFATSLGPWIVTPEELAGRQAGRPGVYDLAMTARVDGAERSRGNWRDIRYSFAEMIARASQDAYVLPGEVLGSGTVGTGCLLELTRGEGPWLQPGDVVELEVERLGVLRNRVGDRQFVAPGTSPEGGKAAVQDPAQSRSPGSPFPDP